MFCEKSVIVDPEHPKTKILNVQVLDQTNNFNHVICIKCHEKNKSLRLDSVECRLCSLNHHINTKIWDTYVVSDNNCGCCLIF